MKPHDVVVEAKTQLQDLTGLVADSVSDMSHEDGGWRLVVNMIELKRIPAATDVLAAFDVRLDEDGNVTGYHRSRRYLRDQVAEDA